MDEEIQQMLKKTSPGGASKSTTATSTGAVAEAGEGGTTTSDSPGVERDEEPKGKAAVIDDVDAAASVPFTISTPTTSSTEAAPRAPVAAADHFSKEDCSAVCCMQQRFDERMEHSVADLDEIVKTHEQRMDSVISAGSAGGHGGEGETKNRVAVEAAVDSSSSSAGGSFSASAGVDLDEIAAAQMSSTDETSSTSKRLEVDVAAPGRDVDAESSEGAKAKMAKPEVMPPSGPTSSKPKNGRFFTTRKTPPARPLANHQEEELLDEVDQISEEVQKSEQPVAPASSADQNMIPQLPRDVRILLQNDVDEVLQRNAMLMESVEGKLQLDDRTKREQLQLDEVAIAKDVGFLFSNVESNVAADTPGLNIGNKVHHDNDLVHPDLVVVNDADSDQVHFETESERRFRYHDDDIHSSAPNSCPTSKRVSVDSINFTSEDDLIAFHAPTLSCGAAASASAGSTSGAPAARPRAMISIPTTTSTTSASIKGTPVFPGADNSLMYPEVLEPSENNNGAGAGAHLLSASNSVTSDITVGELLKPSSPPVPTPEIIAHLASLIRDDSLNQFTCFYPPAASSSNNPVPPSPSSRGSKRTPDSARSEQSLTQSMMDGGEGLGGMLRLGTRTQIFDEPDLLSMQEKDFHGAVVKKVRCRRISTGGPSNGNHHGCAASTVSYESGRGSTISMGSSTTASGSTSTTHRNCASSISPRFLDDASSGQISSCPLQGRKAGQRQLSTKLSTAKKVIDNSHRGPVRADPSLAATATERRRNARRFPSNSGTSAYRPRSQLNTTASAKFQPASRVNHATSSTSAGAPSSSSTAGFSGATSSSSSFLAASSYSYSATGAGGNYTSEEQGASATGSSRSRAAAVKPDWNASVSDMTRYKLDQKQAKKRKMTRISNNLSMASANFHEKISSMQRDIRPYLPEKNGDDENQPSAVFRSKVRTGRLERPRSARNVKTGATSSVEQPSSVAASPAVSTTSSVGGSSGTVSRSSAGTATGTTSASNAIKPHKENKETSGPGSSQSHDNRSTMIAVKQILKSAPLSDLIDQQLLFLQ
eukprot:CAMPEP_0178995430 /NCGR_PEP_ID=MMETSP0795-20121207/7824_1 /TAXON_ID=88552 /ORGANISM="Amoebophrya sp., Strain Ameob2" /LENGTH=1049 /DNA_ID=CAMNT_0020687739 /DNA_START=433 /DNA_END=3582 /DNA_ORIENTATION=-